MTRASSSRPGLQWTQTPSTRTCPRPRRADDDFKVFRFHEPLRIIYLWTIDNYLKDQSSRLAMWKSLSEARHGLLKVWTGCVRPWRSSSSIHSPKPSWSWGRKQFSYFSGFEIRLWHTWTHDEGVEAGPDDEVVVAPPVVDLHGARGEGEEPGLARAVEVLADSRRVWQERPEDFLFMAKLIFFNVDNPDLILRLNNKEWGSIMVLTISVERPQRESMMESRECCQCQWEHRDPR